MLISSLDLVKSCPPRVFLLIFCILYAGRACLETFDSSQSKVASATVSVIMTCCMIVKPALLNDLGKQRATGYMRASFADGVQSI